MGSTISHPIDDKKNTTGDPVINAMREYGWKFVIDPITVRNPHIRINVSTKRPV